MRMIVKIVILVAFSSSLFAQDWKETLDLAREKYRSKEYSKSCELYCKAAKSAPKEINLANEIAQAAYKSKDYSTALANYSLLEKKKVKNKSAIQHNLGNSFYQQKEYSRAIDSYKNALRLNPSDQETRYNLALAMSKQNKNKKKPKQNQSNQNQPPNQSPPSQKQKNKPKDKPSDSPQSNQNKMIPKDKTDRMLDDLMKQEMNTKKNKNKTNATPNNSNNGKDW